MFANQQLAQDTQDQLNKCFHAVELVSLSELLKRATCSIPVEKTAADKRPVLVHLTSGQCSDTLTELNKAYLAMYPGTDITLSERISDSGYLFKFVDRVFEWEHVHAVLSACTESGDTVVAIAWEKLERSPDHDTDRNVD